LTNLAILALNFEAGGRVPVPRRPRASPTPAQLAAVEFCAASASSMLRASQGPLEGLGLGRGKIASAWEVSRALDLIEGARPQDQVGHAYGRYGAVAGQLPRAATDVAEDVDPGRLKLPKVAAVFEAGPFLPQDDIREGFLDPAVLTDPDKAPFTGRTCDRVPEEVRDEFVSRLDSASMLVAVRQPLGPPSGFFAVRKAWDAERQVWVQRLVMDRRGRNAEERQVYAAEDTTPHGVVFCEVQLDEDEDLVSWCSDLASFYYAFLVTAERARSNCFTPVGPLARWAHTAAVRALVAAELGCAVAELRGDEDPGSGALAIGTMAMGDLNATIFGQHAHTTLLRVAGCLAAAHTIAYRSPWPRGPLAEGVMIDDRVLTCRLPRSGPARAARLAEADAVWRAGEQAYAAGGLPEAVEKRQVQEPSVRVWGCEVRGEEGRVGTALEKRAGLAAVTTSVAVGGVCTAGLLRRLLGCWTDVLLYRRPAFGVLDAVYKFVERYAPGDADTLVRVLPGPVVSELLMLAALAPLLETDIRARVSERIYVSDASPSGAAAVVSVVPPEVAGELWRHRIRRGGEAGREEHRGARGGAVFGEFVEGLPAHDVVRFQFADKPHINVGELRARRALLRWLANDVNQHGRRHVIVYDSMVAIGAAARGRSPSPALLAELRRTYPHQLAANIQEGALWTDSERNTADASSRGGVPPVPAPRREWAARLIAGDFAALDARIRDPGGEGVWAGEVGEPNAPEPPSPPALPDPLEASGDAASTRRTCSPGSERRRRAAVYVPGVMNGYGSEGPRPRPGGGLRQTDVDLRARTGGTPAVAAHRGKMVEEFSDWLDARDPPEQLEELARDPPRVARLAADFGQSLWSAERAQCDFSELLNALAKLYLPLRVRGALGFAWDVRTAWQQMEPGVCRAPLPARLARAMAAVALAWDWTSFAVTLLLAFEGALRPGDFMNLERRDLRFPALHDVAGAGRPVHDEHGHDDQALYVVLRHSKTAKTRGARWQHVRIQCPRLIHVSRVAFGDLPPRAYLFDAAGSAAVRARAFTSCFQAVLGFLGVPYGEHEGFVPSSLRAGGITALFQHTQDIPLVRWRGRWDGDRSMEHYLQELPYHDAFARLPAETRTKIFRIGRLLPVFLPE